MKIRTWLILSNLIIISMILAMAILQMMKVKKTIQFNEIENNRITAVSLINEIFHTSENLAHIVAEYIVTPNDSVKHKYSKMVAIRDGLGPRPVNVSIAPLRTIPLVNLIREHNLTDEEFIRIEDLLTITRELNKINSTILENTPIDFALDDIKRINTLNSLYGLTYITNLSKIRISSEKLVLQIHNRLNAQEIPMQNALNKYTMYNYILLISSLLILIITTILSYTRIFSRLKTTTDYVTNIQNHAVPGGLKTNISDEIGSLNTSINATSIQYKSLIQSREFCKNIQALTLNLQPTAKELFELSQQLDNHLNISINGAHEQAMSISGVVASIGEMNATVFEVAKSASSAADIANQAKTKAEEGERFVQSLISSIETVHSNSTSLKDDMETLLNHTQKVNEIMNVITDIADQTNLLALNAAIEAARAGDAGRGFAVVADEVRKLAEKTMFSTTGVGNVIKSIQSSAKNSTQQVDVTVANINNITLAARECGIALQAIVLMSENSADQVRSIATASEEQSVSSDEITSSISQINTFAINNESTMYEAKVAIQAMEGARNRLSKCLEYIATAKI